MLGQMGFYFWQKRTGADAYAQGTMIGFTQCVIVSGYAGANQPIASGR